MANRLRQIRCAKMMSQSELARVSGISRQTINKLELDPEKGTNSKTMLALARALDTRVEDLFFAVTV